MTTIIERQCAYFNITKNQKNAKTFFIQKTGTFLKARYFVEGFIYKEKDTLHYANFL